MQQNISYIYNFSNFYFHYYYTSNIDILVQSSGAQHKSFFRYIVGVYIHRHSCYPAFILLSPALLNYSHSGKQSVVPIYIPTSGMNLHYCANLLTLDCWNFNPCILEGVKCFLLLALMFIFTTNKTEDLFIFFPLWTVIHALNPFFSARWLIFIFYLYDFFI